MTAHGRHQSLRLFAVVAVVALLAAPVHAFFAPSKAITVPTYPGSSTGHGGTTGGTTSHGGTTGTGGGSTISTPQTAPEPTSLVLALLGSGGLSLFAACRRRRERPRDRARSASEGLHELPRWRFGL